MTNALNVAWKELQLLWRDKGELAVLFVMPIMFASIIGAAFGGAGGAPGIGVYLVNDDQGVYGQQIAETLREVTVLRVTELDSVAEADALVANSRGLAAILIPEGLSDAIETFDRAEVRVIADPTQQQYASLVTGVVNDVVLPVVLRGEITHGINVIAAESPAYAQLSPEQRAGMEAQTLGAIMTQLQRSFEAPLVAVRAEQLEELTSRNLKSASAYSVPAYAVMFSFFVMGTAGAALLREKEDGTLRRLRAAPISRSAIIGGKMLAYILVVVLQVVVVFAVGRAFFDVSFGRSPLGFVLLVVALALSPTALGLLLATISKTPAQAGNISMVAGILLGIVGGSVVYTGGSGPLGSISKLTPHYYATQGLLELSSWGGGLVDVLPNIGVLLLFGGVLFALAVWRLRSL